MHLYSCESYPMCLCVHCTCSLVWVRIHVHICDFVCVCVHLCKCVSDCVYSGKDTVYNHVLGELPTSQQLDQVAVVVLVSHPAPYHQTPTIFWYTIFNLKL